MLRILNDLFRIRIPDPALNFPSSGSGSVQKFRIHADPDPTYIKVYLKNYKNTLNSIKKKNLPTICHSLYSISYYCTVLQYKQSRFTVLFRVADPDPHGSGTFAWIHPDQELQFRIRIQQKVKEQINKTVNSGLVVL